MPQFGERSNKNLRECHRDLRVLFREVIEHFDCSIIEGFRPEDEQNKAYHAGKSKLMFPESKHNQDPSQAVDAVPFPVDWNDHRRMYMFGGFVLGVAARLYSEGKMNYRVRWGGDWDGDTENNDQTFHDLPHFELIGVE